MYQNSQNVVTVCNASNHVFVSLERNVAIVKIKRESVHSAEEMLPFFKIKRKKTHSTETNTSLSEQTVVIVNSKRK